MKKFKQAILGTAILGSFSFSAVYPCTIFSLYPNGQHWVGRTFDWSYGHGLVQTNKRSVTKRALQLLPTDVASVWTSKYGSVTFNQFGREFPNGGMNEEGLLIEALELTTSAYPAPDSRPSFNELQFIQYILDNFKTVGEIESAMPALRLAPVGSKLHYFACDMKECMTIEYINGALVTHRGETLPISGLANDSYADHAEYASQFVSFGGNKPVIQDSKDSLDRFVRGNYNAKSINDYADKTQALFGFLSDVGTGSNRWQIIYNQDEKVITFRTTEKLSKQRIVDLKAFDFACQTATQYFDLSSDLEGQINPEFKDFDPAFNYGIIKKSVEEQELPAALAGRLAIYPNETKCN